MIRVDLPDPTSLLATDVLRLETELDAARLDAQMWREMCSEALTLLNAAIAAHADLVAKGRS